MERHEAVAPEVGKKDEAETRTKVLLRRRVW